MLAAVNNFLKYVDDLVWGVPLIVAILLTGIYLTIRLKGIQITKLPKALKYMFENEESGHGEVTSFGALCTALSATIGTGNIVGVATAIVAGGPGALFWMEIAALFGMATKYSEGLLAIKYRTTDKHGHILGGPFYYIENGMGKKWTWLAKIFAFFGMGVGLFGIGTFTQVNGITSAVGNFFDPNAQNVIHLLGRDYTLAVVISGLILTVCVGLVVIGGLKRIAKVSEIVVPFMAVIYITISLLLLILNAGKIPAAVAEIVSSAFGSCSSRRSTWSDHCGNAERYRKRYLLKRGRTGKCPDRSSSRSDKRAGTSGTGYHDRYLYRYDRCMYHDRTFYCDHRFLEYRTGRCGSYHKCIPAWTSVCTTGQCISADDVSGVLRIYHHPRMGLLQ